MFGRVRVATSLLMVLIPVFTIYGPVELTRVILDWEGFSAKFIFEVCFMWLFYGLAMFSLIVVTRRIRRVNNEDT